MLNSDMRASLLEKVIMQQKRREYGVRIQSELIDQLKQAVGVSPPMLAIPRGASQLLRGLAAQAKEPRHAAKKHGIFEILALRDTDNPNTYRRQKRTTTVVILPCVMPFQDLGSMATEVGRASQVTAILTFKGRQLACVALTQRLSVLTETPVD
jgi:hypothetical protein